jgi:hypothetical protein
VFPINLDSLISTVAASTAAIVAIVGGLIISRLLSLSSEKNGVVRRLRELVADVGTLQQQSDEISEFLLRDDAEDFIKDHAKDLVLDGTPFEELVDVHNYPYRTVEELRPFIQMFEEVKEDFYKIVERDDFDLPEEFDYFFKNEKLAFPERRFYYKTIFREFDKELLRRTKGPYGSVKYMPMISTATVPSYSIQYYRQQKTERDRLDGEIALLKKQIEVQRATLQAYGKPDGVWSGLFVIMYSCLVSVVWPCMLLPYEVNRYNDQLTRWTILGFFFSALLALFVYIGWSTYKLTRSEEIRSKDE